VQEDDLEAFRSVFNTQISIENYNKLSPQSQDYARRLIKIGRRITFVTQTMQQGFGHAVFCAKEAVGNEPFLLMLGDHIYRSNGGPSCTRQLLNAYQQHGMNILGLRRTPEELIENFGTATGVWVKEHSLISVSEFSEKPTLEYARSNLHVPDLPEGEYLTVFGLYILPPRVFDFIQEHINHNVRERGEFQLTSAIDRLRQEQGFLGLIINGRRFDIGLPESYINTIQDFSKS